MIINERICLNSVQLIEFTCLFHQLMKSSLSPLTLFSHTVLQDMNVYQYNKKTSSFIRYASFSRQTNTHTYTCKIPQVQDKKMRQELQKIRQISAYNSISMRTRLRHSACPDYVHHFITCLSQHMLRQSSFHFQQSGLTLRLLMSYIYVYIYIYIYIHIYIYIWSAYS